MRRVLKCILDHANWTTLSLRKGAIPIEVAEQNGLVAVWFICDDSMPLELVDFFCANTGEEIPTSTGRYIGTAHIHNGRTVVHVFMRK